MKKVSFLAVILMGACQSKPDADYERLKHLLFGPFKDVSEYPVYSDPATGDYDEVAKGYIMLQLDSATIPLLQKYRTELEPMVLQYIDSGICWAYLAAYLKYENALPKLKKQLLETDKFYGWEGGNYDSLDRYLDDEQYCYQMSYVASIEYITKKSLDQAITLTPEERMKLEARAKKCVLSDTLDGEDCSALWLLQKMKLTKTE